MPFFEYDDVRLHYRDEGRGVPFFFQHGLGGNVDQAFALCAPRGGIRVLSFDCRAHGQSSAGPKDEIHFATFVGDLLALMNHLEIPTALIGGISMGAAVALNFALRFPDRVLGLVLLRPAWLDAPNPRHLRVFSLVAELLTRHGPEEGLRIFKSRPEFSELQSEFPETAKSLENQFLRPRATETAEAMEQIPKDQPHPEGVEWTRIRVPTMVLSNRFDPNHPFEYGPMLAARIPGACFHELTSKSVDPLSHQRQVQSYLEEFIRQFAAANPGERASFAMDEELSLLRAVVTRRKLRIA